jgi:hypothetical protein
MLQHMLTITLNLGSAARYKASDSIQDILLAFNGVHRNFFEPGAKL